MKKIHIRRTIYILIAIALVGGLIIYRSNAAKNAVQYNTVKAEKGELIQTVSETGTVKSANELELSFLQSGNIAQLAAETGAIVKKDQILAELDLAGLRIQEKQSQASVDVAKAGLSKVLSGATPEAIAVAQAQVDQAYSNYKNSQKDLDNTLSLTQEAINQANKTYNDLIDKSKTTVTTQEQAVTTAQTSLDNTKLTYQKALDKSQTNAITTIEKHLSTANVALDAVNKLLTDQDGKNALSVKDITYLDSAKSGYDLSKIAYTAAQMALADAKSKPGTAMIISAIEDSMFLLNKTYSTLEDSFSALEYSVTGSVFSQTEVDAYKTTISGHLASVNAGITAIQTAQHALDDAKLSYDTSVSGAENNLLQAKSAYDSAVIASKNALNSAKLTASQQIASGQSRIDSAYEAWQLAKRQLSQVKSPARTQDIESARAQLKQAEANLDSIRNQINNGILRSPIDGIITKVNYSVGEQASPAKPVFSILQGNNLEVEIDISETDIEKVKLGNPVIITLDAFGDNVKYAGKVSFIEPAATVIQSVIYYKTTIVFDALDKTGEIKTGMTANASIQTAKKADIVKIPQRAIIEKNSHKVVRILKGKDIAETEVTTGLRGDGGMIEITAGLTGGEEIILSTKTK